MPHRSEPCAVQEYLPPNGRGHCCAQHLARENKWLVAILTSRTEHIERVGQLVVNLQPIAIRIVKINALLAHVIDDPYYLDAVILQRKIGVLQGLEAIHLERKVMHSEAILEQWLDGRGIMHGREVNRMATPSVMNTPPCTDPAHHFKTK